MKDLIKTGSALLGAGLDDDQTDRLIEYARILREWNERMNLTAITDDEGVAVKHFLDSLTALLTGRVGGRVLDVGTGAGFPGLVLKIARPAIQLTLLDSLNKRVTFLKAVSEELGLDGIEFIHGRAEDFAHRTEYRAAFDTVVSRAVARMRTLSEWCIPYVRAGGYFLAMKGPLADEELSDAKRVIAIMGGSIEEVMEAEIPFTDLRHKIICVKKVRQTPTRFPRKPAIAAKMSVEQCYKMRK